MRCRVVINITHHHVEGILNVDKDELNAEM